MSLPIHTLRRLVEIGGGLLWAVGLSACTYQGHDRQRSAPSRSTRRMMQVTGTAIQKE